MKCRRKWAVKGVGVAWADGPEDYKNEKQTRVFKMLSSDFWRPPCWPVLYLTLPGVREGWVTGVQPSRNLREAVRNESLRQDGLPNACKCFSYQSPLSGREWGKGLHSASGVFTGASHRKCSQEQEFPQAPVHPRRPVETVSPRLKWLLSF